MEKLFFSRPPARPGSGYLPTLDGWRAIAILSVLLCHDRVHHLGPLSTEWFRLHGGAWGVSLFFALSGLLICSRLLQEESLRGFIDLKGFYVRRLCRIQPAALLYLGILLVLMLIGALNRHFDDLLSSLFFVRNYVLRHSAEESWYTAHFWSLAIEEHFYLFLPGFLVLVRRFRATFLLALFVAMEACRLAFLPAAIQNYQTDLEAGTIVFASAVAVLLVRPVLRAWCVRWLPPWLAIAIVAVIWTRILTRSSRLDHPAFVLSLPLLIVGTMLHPRSLLSRALEFKPLKFIGLISYSLYLWQQLFLVTTFTLPVPHWAFLAYLQRTPWRYAAIFGLSVASYYLLERPLMRFGHRLAQPATPGRDDMRPAA